MSKRAAVAMAGVAVVGVAWAASATVHERLVDWYVSSQTSAVASLPPVPPRGIPIPFELVTHHLLLQAAVGGSSKAPLTFALDTGDKWAVVDLERARQLGLSLEGEIELGGVGPGHSTGAFVRDASFSLSAFPGFSQPLNLAVPLASLAPRLGRACDGILGTRFLEGFVVEVDYESRTLTLHDKDAFSYLCAGEAVPIGFNAEGHPTLKAELSIAGSDPIRGTFVLDLGADEDVVLYSPAVAAHHLPGPALATVKAIGGSGIGGASESVLCRAASLRVGKLVLPGPIVRLARDAAGAYADARVQGSIGARIGSRFRLFLDYSHGRIVLEPRPAASQPASGVSSGLRIEAEGADYRAFRVKEVLAGSPGSEAGLRAGDVLEEVDGQKAASWTLGALAEALELPATYRLTVMREGRTLQVTLTPRPLV